MENRKEKKKEYEVNTGVIEGFKELSLSYYIEEPLYLLYIPIMVT